LQLIIYALKENFNANFNEYNIEDVSNFDEEFTDKYDNNYAISIFSSIYDIYWELNEYPDDDTIINSIHYEVKYNEH